MHRRCIISIGTVNAINEIIVHGSGGMVEVDGEIRTVEGVAREANVDTATVLALAKAGQGARLLTGNEAIGRMNAEDMRLLKQNY